MTDRPPPPDRVVATPAMPLPWRYSGHAWRLGRRVTRRRLDLFLRARSAAALPGARARFLAMGLPPDVVDGALRLVRSVAGWPDAWTWAAQRLLGEARQQASAGHVWEAADARRCAALAYHAAELLAYDDPKKARALRASATTLYAQAVPTLLPDARRVDVRWRATRLPAYLLCPENLATPPPLAVLLNGATTTKEELLAWRGRFLAHGLAVLTLDWPGTGEAAGVDRATADCEDLTDGVLDVAAEHRLDARRVALVGFSLGGALAVRAAALDRRIAACVAVTPPYDARPWLGAATPLLFDQLAAFAGGPDRAAELAAQFALPDVMVRMRCPLLVLGAGRDLVVPPGDAVRLAAAAGDLGTLVWFPDAAHGLYDRVDTWTDDAARWLSTVLGPYRPFPSTQVDAAPRTEPALAVRRSDGTGLG